jgi:hypothetical protein
MGVRARFRRQGEAGNEKLAGIRRCIGPQMNANERALNMGTDPIK